MTNFLHSWIPGISLCTKSLLDLFFLPIHKQFLKLKMVSFLLYPSISQIYAHLSILIPPKHNTFLSLTFFPVSYLSETLDSIIHGWPAFLCALTSAPLLTSKLKNKHKQTKIKLWESFSQPTDSSQNLLISSHNLFPPRSPLSSKSYPPSCIPFLQTSLTENSTFMFLTCCAPQLFHTYHFT